MGLSEEDIEAHFGGPAFLAWFRMGNLNSWGGPLWDGNGICYICYSKKKMPLGGVKCDPFFVNPTFDLSP
jgi:hypothetical protein